ncbi:MAG: PAS domain S-box protein [Candidatus Kapaibacterium sp.]
MESQNKDYLNDLKKRAEQALKKSEYDAPDMSRKELAQALEDLQIYHIELEMQNEELIRLQTELNRQHEKYRDLYDRAPVGYVTIDEKGRILEANATFGEMVGVPGIRLAGHPIIDFFAPECRVKFLESKSEMIRTGEKRECESKLALAGGNIDVLMQCNPETDPETGAAFLKISISDISRMKAAEQQLRTANAHMAAISDSTAHGIIIVDPDYRIVTFNRIASGLGRQIFGQEMAAGNPILDFMRGADRDAFENNFRKAMRGKDPQVVKILNTSENNELAFQFHYTPVKGPGGEVSGVCLSIADVTENIRYQNQINKTRILFERLFHVNHDSLIFVRKSDLTISEVNDTFCRKANISRDSVIGMPLADTALFGDQESMNDFLNRIEKDGIIEDFEHEFLRTDGDSIIFQLSGANVEINEDDFFLISADDITIQKIAEDKLIRSERDLKAAIESKDKFFSIISHDLKNPIGGFIGLSEELLHNFRQLSISQIREVLFALHESSRHLYKLLNNLLQWSIIQRDRLRLKPRTVRVVDSANRAAELYAINASEKNIEINSKVDPGHSVVADPDMLDLVLRNLVSNAIKFTKPGGNIYVNSSESEDFIEVTVEDNGVGIPPKRLEVLFNIEDISPTNGTASERGTGLGLILCKELIEKMGGKFDVESHENNGSKFIFTLPKA